MYNLVERENEIITVLNELEERKFKFIVVGGYAVSAFRHRFSIDADIVIKKEDEKIFEKILKERGYRKIISTKLQNVYSSEFVRYENKELKVSVDLLISGIGVRQTGAAFSFEFLLEHSHKRLIEGIEKTVKAHVPKKEILIVLKLHSGRLTDLRDVAALSFGLNFEIIRKYLFKGGQEVLKKNIKKLLSLIEKSEFQDSFKGVFMEKKFNIDVKEIKKFKELLK